MPLHPPIVLTGSRSIVEQAMREHRRRRPFGVVGAVLIIAAYVVLLTFGVWQLLRSADNDPWMWIAGGVLTLLVIIFTPLLIRSLRRAGRRGRRVEAACTDPMMVGVETSMMPAGFVPVAWPDQGAIDADSSPVYRPIRRILYRPGSSAVARMLCYVPTGFWRWAAQRPDSRPDWNHRHCLAWLFMRVSSNAVIVDAIEAVPVKVADDVWRGRSGSALGLRDEPGFGDIAGDENFIIG